jgi:glycosyltransferase involved in cell wall biosynthesis
MTEARAVAFVAANTFEYESRHRRAAEALAADGWNVVVVAMAGSGLPDEELLADGVVLRRPRVDRSVAGWLPRPLRRAAERLIRVRAGAERLPPREPGPRARARGVIGRGLEILAYRRRVGPWASAVVAAAPDARVFVAKALVALPVAAEAARRTGGRYVYDVADLHVESGRLAALPAPLKAYLRGREARWMRRAAAVLAVTPAMADEIARRFHVARPTVVMNARERWRPDEAAPRPTRLREAADLAARREVVLYQGAFRPDQGIEELLAALAIHPLAGRAVTAAFLGFGPLDGRLRRAAAASKGHVKVLPPVPSDELLEWTAGADVAFVGTPPVTRNQRLTTPNKLFESAMAGVPVVVADGTWTAGLVREHGLGAVVDPWTPLAIAEAIAGLLEPPAAERLARRKAIRKTALETLNWETERRRLLEAFRRLA